MWQEYTAILHEGLVGAAIQPYFMWDRNWIILKIRLQKVKLIITVTCSIVHATGVYCCVAWRSVGTTVYLHIFLIFLLPNCWYYKYTWLGPSPLKLSSSTACPPSLANLSMLVASGCLRQCTNCSQGKQDSNHSWTRNMKTRSFYQSWSINTVMAYI